MPSSMTRTLSFVLFIAIACALLGLIHYYLWARLVRDTGLPVGWHRALTGLFIALFASVPLTFVLGRLLPRSISATLLVPSQTWLGVMFLMLVAVLIVDATKGVSLLADRVLSSPIHDPSRRDAMNRLFGFAALALGAGGSGAALFGGARFAVKRVEVPLARLPKALDGLTIAQLSDVHIGPSLGSRFLKDVVRTVNELSPDLVAITGDLVDGSVEQLGGIVAELANLQSRHGTFFVTGNHEYYSGAQSWCDELTSLGIRVLRNECVAIEQNGHGFDLAGIDDEQAARFGNGHGADLPRAVLGRDTTRELVLLAHQPKAVVDAQEHGVGLQLSGHTHGGQLWPFNWLVKLQQPVVAGLEMIGKTWVYVSCGTGYWGPPMRLGAPAEVTQIVLRSQAS